MTLIAHPSGDYLFLPGIAPYSCGAVAADGFEIIQVTFQVPLPYIQGLAKMTEFLKAHQRPQAAVCGISLRSPKPYTFAGFSKFNASYAKILESWGVFVNGVNPVARTNVAPVVNPPGEPVLYGFSFTSPCSVGSPRTFVVAGAGELPEGVLERSGIVELGNTSAAGISAKARFVMDLMESRLHGLGADWHQVTTVNIYTEHEIQQILPKIVLNRTSKASIHSAAWHFSRPPIEEIEYEMDMRGTRTELRI